MKGVKGCMNRAKNGNRNGTDVHLGAQIHSPRSPSSLLPLRFFMALHKTLHALHDGFSKAGRKIIDDLVERSKAFGTTVEWRNGIGIVKVR